MTKAYVVVGVGHIITVECGECAPCSVWKVNEGKWEHEFFGVIDYLIQQATFQRI